MDLIERIDCLFFHLLQLKSDSKFNFIVTRILGQYVNFRARQTAANTLLGKEQVQDICEDIWNKINTFVGPYYTHLIMVMLRTDAKNYPLDVVLYPLFNKTHEVFLRQQRQPFPQIVTIIVAVLFYKHWLEMCTRKRDRQIHREKACTALKKNFDCIKSLTNEEKEKFSGFQRRVDDRFYHLYKFRHSARYKLCTTTKSSHKCSLYGFVSI